MINKLQDNKSGDLKTRRTRFTRGYSQTNNNKYGKKKQYQKKNGWCKLKYYDYMKVDSIFCYKNLSIYLFIQMLTQEESQEKDLKKNATFYCEYVFF